MAKILKVGLAGQEGSEEEYLSQSSDPLFSNCLRSIYHHFNFPSTSSSCQTCAIKTFTVVTNATFQSIQ